MACKMNEQLMTGFYIALEMQVPGQGKETPHGHPGQGHILGRPQRPATTGPLPRAHMSTFSALSATSAGAQVPVCAAGAPGKWSRTF